MDLPLKGTFAPSKNDLDTHPRFPICQTLSEKQRMYVDLKKIMVM